MAKEDEVNREVAHHILPGSTTMIGVCITVITLFRVMKPDYNTYADELLAFDNLFFITAAIFSYSSIRRDHNRKLERVADISFLTGMILMLVAGIMIIYSA